MAKKVEIMKVWQYTFFYKGTLYKKLEAEKGSENKEFLGN